MFERGAAADLEAAHLLPHPLHVGLLQLEALPRRLDRRVPLVHVRRRQRPHGRNLGEEGTTTDTLEMSCERGRECRAAEGLGQGGQEEKCRAVHHERTGREGTGLGWFSRTLRVMMCSSSGLPR